MSRVYFHSPSEPAAELRGSERAYLGCLAQNVAEGLLDLRSLDRIDRLRNLLHPTHHMARADTAKPGWASKWAQDFGLAVGMVNSFGTRVLHYDGRDIPVFDLMLNSALAVGSDQIRLAARIHGGCENHGWVDGPDRAWLADIMQTGIDTGVYRTTLPYYRNGEIDSYSDQGWNDVIALLRKRDDEPVVMSYSVTDQFPNRAVAGGTHGDDWYELTDTERWAKAMGPLRANETGEWGGQLRPDVFATSRFGTGLTILDLYAWDWEDRLRKALFPEEQKQA